MFSIPKKLKNIFYVVLFTFQAFFCLNNSINKIRKKNKTYLDTGEIIEIPGNTTSDTLTDQIYALINILILLIFVFYF